MNIDYWQKFVQTGSVTDYLNYRNSISADLNNKNNGKSDNKSDRDSNKRDKNQRER
ncbi:MAG: hypothetical protein IKJ05_01170 [Oscillospiraceae bacterium]|nr:hypothetical protein [Oscillospiraceae bacterium]